MSAKKPSLFLLGTSHRVASLEERERISLPADSIDAALRQIGRLALIPLSQRIRIFWALFAAGNHQTTVDTKQI